MMTTPMPRHIELPLPRHLLHAPLSLYQFLLPQCLGQVNPSYRQRAPTFTL